MNSSDLSNVVLSYMYPWETPEFCDAVVVSADLNGVPCTDEELDQINENRELVFQLAMKGMY